MNKIKAIAGPNVEIVGHVDAARMTELMQQAKPSSSRRRRTSASSRWRRRPAVLPLSPMAGVGLWKPCAAC